MADKFIHIRINVKKINKEWLYTGEKGNYLDAVVHFNEVQDSYGSNGMITQSVPKDVYLKDKTIKGVILGNSKVWEKNSDDRSESIPGGTKPVENNTTQSGDDEDNLPF